MSGQRTTESATPSGEVTKKTGAEPAPEGLCKRTRTTCRVFTGSWSFLVGEGCPLSTGEQLQASGLALYVCSYALGHKSSVSLNSPEHQQNCRPWSQTKPHTLEVSRHQQERGQLEHQRRSSRFRLGQLRFSGLKPKTSKYKL